MISLEYNEQYSAQLPEEIQLNKILNDYQEWQDSFKKVFQVNILTYSLTYKN